MRIHSQRCCGGRGSGSHLTDEEAEAQRGDHMCTELPGRSRLRPSAPWRPVSCSVMAVVVRPPFAAQAGRLGAGLSTPPTRIPTAQVPWGLPPRAPRLSHPISRLVPGLPLSARTCPATDQQAKSRPPTPPRESCHFISDEGVYGALRCVIILSFY